jgi:hypothetical protein
LPEEDNLAGKEDREFGKIGGSRDDIDLFLPCSIYRLPIEPGTVFYPFATAVLLSNHVGDFFARYDEGRLPAIHPNA